MFRIINTKKEKKYLSLSFLREQNIDGKGGLRVIDIEKYMSEASHKIKEIDLKGKDLMTTINKREYINMALKTASIFVENGVYCGVVKAMPGVWAQGDTEEECLRELASCAESWIEAREIEGL